MNIEYIEWGLVILILILQFFIFFRTKKQINLFKNTIPQISSVSVTRVNIPQMILEKNSPTTILRELAKLKNYQKNAEHFDRPLSQITLIEVSENGSEVFDKILYSINTYLIKNQGAVSDFNLLKDITERNTDAVEEDINLTISIPLYLGLMGTMLGIVIGLFSMADLLTGEPNQGSMATGITILLGGVKIAMIASFAGLFLTTLNSGLYFKGSKSLVETKKNEFYTFIQTELLPALNQGLGATFDSLQKNLSRFNEEFTGNIDKISGLFITNYDTLVLQEKIFSSLENLDIATIAKYNITVLQQMETSTKEFEKFNNFVSNVNSSIENSSQIIDRLNGLMQRTENLEKIGQTINFQLEQSKSLLDFLSLHFEKLEEYKQLTSDSVAQTGFSISDMFKALKEQMQDSTQSLRDFTVEEVNLLKTALSESKTNIGHLQFLENIKTDVSEFKVGTMEQSKMISHQLESMKKSIDHSNRILKDTQMVINADTDKNTGFRNSIKKWFSSNGDGV